jgi:hypothetical protein
MLNNQLHGQRTFAFSSSLGLPPCTAGVKFQELTLAAEIGAEVVMLWVDPTPFAVQLQGKKPFELRLKWGAADTAGGTIFFLLWCVPPVTDGKPFALCEQLLNPAHGGTVEGLRRASEQTHLHVILVGAGEEILSLYELENTFGLDELASAAEAIGESRKDVDFDAATREYKQTYDVMELFLKEPEARILTKQKSEEERSEIELDDEENPDEIKFLVPESTRRLIDSAMWLAARLLGHPECNGDMREALAKALWALARLPEVTPGLDVDFGFSAPAGGEDIVFWSVSLDETEVSWTAGGFVHGPAGGDSFTSFNMSLFRGSEDLPMGHGSAWFEFKKHLEEAYDIQADDNSEDGFWDHRE